MLKKSLIFLLIIALFALFPVSKTHAEESIARFISNNFVNESGIVTIIEEITYDFGQNQRRGIFREIQQEFTNSEGITYKTPINILDVRDAQGNPITYVTNDEGQYLNVRIGDEDVFVTGTQIYIITYEVTGAIESFSDHDEYFPNITGNKTQVPTQFVSATVHLPSQISKESIKVTCFTGEFGEKTQNCGWILDENNVVTIETTQPLAPNEGISAAVAFEKGIVNVIPKEQLETSGASPIWDKIVQLLTFIWYFGLPVVMLLIFLRFGRDPKPLYNSVPPLFEPPKDDQGNRLTPGEVGTIYDESVDSQDITATIVDLAIRGYIKIEELDSNDRIDSLVQSMGFSPNKDFKFTLLKDADESLKPHEKLLIEKMFAFGKHKDVTTEELKSKFSGSANKIKEELYNTTVKEGYFSSHPDKVRKTWYGIGAFLIFTGNILGSIAAFIFGNKMPRKTRKGVKTRTDAAGLKKFLTSQEKQLEYQEENWFLFEKLLPYAIAFGVTETWAKRFEHLSNIPHESDWYVGNSLISNPALFASSLSSLNNSMAQAATPTSSSSGFSSGFSGGGFSGGGFSGGGGTGSW